VDAVVDGISQGVASASKKKVAQTQAATLALEELKVDIPELVQKVIFGLCALAGKNKTKNATGFLLFPIS
jgi:hypothetical protein